MPSPFGPKGRRSNSNVPAQALTLMNDPFVLDQAKIWAKNTANESDVEKRIANMMRSAHTVTPKGDHVARLAAFVKDHEDKGRNDEKAWADLAHALFNMKSFYFLK